MRKYTLLWAVVCVLAAGVVVSVWQGQVARAHQNDALRAVICFSENYIKHDKKLTPAQKKADRHVYDEMISAGHLTSC